MQNHSCVCYVQVLQTFTRCILRCQDETDYDDYLSMRAVTLMMDNYVEVMKVPEKLKRHIEAKVDELKRSRVRMKCIIAVCDKYFGIMVCTWHLLYLHCCKFCDGDRRLGCYACSTISLSYWWRGCFHSAIAVSLADTLHRALGHYGNMALLVA